MLMTFNYFLGLLSWLLYEWREGYLLPNWARKVTCRCFNWMLQLSSEMMEVPGCWTMMMRRQGGRSNPHPIFDHQWHASQLCMAINSSICSYFFTFALKTNGAFSWNVSKLFTEQITFSSTSIRIYTANTLGLLHPHIRLSKLHQCDKCCHIGFLATFLAFLPHPCN